jgi:hypothetical protein
MARAAFGTDMSFDHQFEVMLPVGFRDAGGALQRRAVLRKMTGVQEEMLYDPGLSAAGLVTQLLRTCLVRLGPRDDVAITEQTVSEMYVADRNYLMLELRRLTLGDRMRAVYDCPSCGGDIVVLEDLAQLEVRRLGDEDVPQAVNLELEDGWQDRHGTVHRNLRLRLPRGSDEEFVARLAERDPFKARDALALRCIECFGSLDRSDLDAYGVKILRELTLGDRQLVFRHLQRDTPGVDFRRSLRCTACSTRVDTVLDATAFFDLG